MLELKRNGTPQFLVVEGSTFRLPNGDYVSPAYEGWFNDSGYELMQYVPPAPEPEPEMSLVDYTANRRWQKETDGVNFYGVTIATDDRSKMMIMGARMAAENDPNFTTKWKIANETFIDLDAETLIAISDAVLAHVANCFAIEEQVLGLIQSGAVTTKEQIDQHFS